MQLPTIDLKWKNIVINLSERSYNRTWMLDMEFIIGQRFEGVSVVNEVLLEMLNNHKLRYKKGYIANRNWTTVEEINYGEIKMACELKLKFKEQMRRLENYFGGRSRIPDIMQFSRPE
ncbi:hypothetical protein Tco_0874630 [Tanacetum coccineum]|uniref:Uncharacterized protein n=1 Tax=Tanacetum coccineum TaxID=301880 RepID=A0ABQ5BST6_9ASTR